MRKFQFMAMIVLGAPFLFLGPVLPNSAKPPGWFKVLDTDQDGQVSLYEWRRAGYQHDDFRKLDLNDDGFITLEEATQYANRERDLKFVNGQVDYYGAIEETSEEKYRGKISYKIFTIRLKKGITYQFELTSPEYYAYLYLTDADGEKIDSNNSGGKGMTARIVHQVEESGTYCVVATSQDGYKTGEFRLKVRVVSRGPAGLPAWFTELDTDGDGQVSLNEWRLGGKKRDEFLKHDLNDDGFITTEEVLRGIRKPIALRLVKGQVNHQSALSAADEKYQGKKPAKTFTLRLEKGKTYQFDLMSKAFDAFLYLENSEGEILARNDDGGEGLNSRILFHATESGTYRLIATHAAQLRPGPFTLSARLLSGFRAYALKALPAWLINLDQDEDGQISLFEWRGSGKKFEAFGEYDLNSDGFITAEEAYRYVKRPAHIRLKNGQAIHNDGIEASTDELHRGKKSYKVFILHLEEGKVYQINHHSKVFQGFLYLEDMDGNVLMENSSPNIGGNSRIVYRANRTGAYRLIATSLGGFRIGPFVITVRSGSQVGVILPKGLPAWFQELDKDGDGQIALYEWRAAGKRFEDFPKFDLNNDGFITAEEMLRYVKTHPEETKPVKKGGR